MFSVPVLVPSQHWERHATGQGINGTIAGQARAKLPLLLPSPLSWSIRALVRAIKSCELAVWVLAPGGSGAPAAVFLGESESQL